ncbi:MAG: hypothetical protein IPL20_06250 [Saprospiraceae bacterium]|nr:hypothetical protein [Saprospiraceae bacterium]
MENGEWEWKVENGKWRMENGKWKMENGKCFLFLLHRYFLLDSLQNRGKTNKEISGTYLY